MIREVARYRIRLHGSIMTIVTEDDRASTYLNVRRAVSCRHRVGARNFAPGPIPIRKASRHNSGSASYPLRNTVSSSLICR